MDYPTHDDRPEISTVFYSDWCTELFWSKVGQRMEISEEELRERITWLLSFLAIDEDWIWDGRSRHESPKGLANEIEDLLRRAHTTTDMGRCVELLLEGRAQFPEYEFVFGVKGDELNALLNIAMGMRHKPDVWQTFFPTIHSMTEDRMYWYHEQLMELIESALAEYVLVAPLKCFPPYGTDPERIQKDLAALGNLLFEAKSLEDVRRCYRVCLQMKEACQAHPKYSYYFLNCKETLKNIVWGVPL